MLSKIGEYSAQHPLIAASTSAPTEGSARRPWVDSPWPTGERSDRGTLNTPTNVPNTEASVRLLLALPLTVALGALDLWAAIPAGLVLRLPRCLAASPLRREAWLGALLVTTAGERLQRLLYSQRWFSKRRERVERLWGRYGLIGVAFQSR